MTDRHSKARLGVFARRRQIETCDIIAAWKAGEL
jgi:hypothetical protein